MKSWWNFQTRKECENNNNQRLKTVEVYSVLKVSKKCSFGWDF